MQLPSGVQWGDELSWQPVDQAVDRGLTGALIVQASAIPSGRPITLASIGQEGGAVPLVDVQQLRSWAAVPLQEMVLTVRGADYAVMWRHQDAPALTAEPLLFFDQTDVTDLYSVTLKFMEI